MQQKAMDAALARLKGTLSYDDFKDVDMVRGQPSWLRAGPSWAPMPLWPGTAGCSAAALPWHAHTVICYVCAAVRGRWSASTSLRRLIHTGGACSAPSQAHGQPG